MPGETGSAFTIEWASPARRALPRLPEKVAAAVIEFVYSQLAQNPARAGHALRFELEGHHSAARGDFRVIYRIDESTRVVIVEAISHRSDAYRSR